MKKILLLIVSAAISVGAFAASKGISPEMLQRLREANPPTAADRAIRNALNSSSIDKLAANAESRPMNSSRMSNKVESRGITDQKSSGRCWLFTGLNVLRSQMMAKHDLGELKLSQNYNFFYDQLEKSNLFLQAVTESAKEPMDSRRVEWLFKNPLSDGGQYTGISDNIMKYGVVPSEVMNETYSANNTSRLRSLLSLKLRKDGLELRKMVAEGKSKIGYCRHSGEDARRDLPHSYSRSRHSPAGIHMDPRQLKGKGCRYTPLYSCGVL